LRRYGSRMRALLVLATLAVWGLAITFGLLMPG
jgi:hypothetical protein